MAQAFINESWKSCLQENPLYGRMIEVLPYSNATIGQHVDENSTYSPPPTPVMPYAIGYLGESDSKVAASLARLSFAPQPSTYANFARPLLARPEPEYATAFDQIPNDEEENDADVESVYDEPREDTAPPVVSPVELAEIRRIAELTRKWEEKCSQKMIELATDRTLDATSEDDLLELIAHATASLQRRHRTAPGYQP